MELLPAKRLINRRQKGFAILGSVILSSGLIPATEVPVRQIEDPFADGTNVPPIIMEVDPGMPAATEPVVETDPLGPLPPEPMIPTSELGPDNLPILIDPASRLEAHPSTPARPAPAFRPIFGSDPEEEEIPLEAGAYDLSIPGEPGLMQLPELAYYSIQDPLARTQLANARGLSDSLYDGVGGVPRPLNFPFLPKLAFPGGRSFHLGPIVYTPSLGAELVFSRNDDRSGGRDIETARGNLIGNIFAGIGDPVLGRFLTFDYTAAQTIGLNSETDDHFDQQLFVVGSLEFVKLRLGMGLEIESLSGYSRDLGGPVERDYLTVALTSTYQITPRTSFDWDITTPNGRLPGGGAGSGDTSGFTSTNFINYEVTPKTHLGLGFSMGLIDVSGGDTQSYQQVLVRHSSTPTPFLSYSANLGMEFRDTGGLYRTHPVFVLGAIWTPRPRTTVKISGEQRIDVSAAHSDANYVTTTVAVSVRQFLGRSSAVYLSAGFENAQYESTKPGVSVDRRDKTFLGQVAFSTNLAERWDLALTLSGARMESDNATNILTQVALQAWFRF